MKPNLSQLIIFILFFAFSSASFAQENIFEKSISNAVKTIDQVQANDKINADSAFKFINHWNNYTDVKGGKDYVFYYTDSLFGKVPFRVFVPANYNNKHKSACILLLHGAVGRMTFADIDSLDKFNDDILFNIISKQGYIVIRPVADERTKKFSWVVNTFDREAANPVYNTLNKLTTSVKTMLNIDDNKVFAVGHSDGSDGSVGLAVYTPNQFAGIIAYNSMLNNTFARDFYIRNIVNTPLYLVHSELDDLRPVQETRLIVEALRKIDRQLAYKEYAGYQHYDKHLDKELPLIPRFVDSVNRKTFKDSIYWELNSTNIYNSCSWLKVTGVDTELPAAPWHKPFNFKSYNKHTKDWYPFQYYNLNKSAAIKGTVANNIFYIRTSGITKVEILISPRIVDLKKPVIININGKQAFSGRVTADKTFMLQGFKSNFDREAIWVNSIKVNVE
ncbi:dienelactone hydrolase family protein [Mucilaginibacter kameinonensis]|uniref:dienelactone hydrolase family protein n=1 Tax=Mucilaginibacter kameinonensis TaxID=452286 RepID=UPI000EF7656C|nr:dienelactone hydrolase family protein [Mucilaginibacter kameinonensis]